MRNFFFICLGGAAGTGARYLVSHLPYGTLSVNIFGSFFISLIMGLSVTTTFIPPAWRVVLTTGVLGGFTTYSSFNQETLQYLQNGQIVRGFLNIFIMFTTCLLASFLGLFLAKRWA